MVILTYNIGKDPYFSSHSGSVFSRSRSGHVARARAKPSYRHTARRELRKGSVCRSGKRWFNALSIYQRSSWSILGASTTWTDPIGNDYNPSGFNLYVRTNSLRDFYGLEWVDLASALAVCTAYAKTFRYVSDSGQLSVISDTSTPDNYRSFYDLSPPLRKTVYSYKDPYTFNAQGSGKIELALGAPGQFKEGDLLNIRWRDMAADGSLSDASYPFFLLEDSEPPETPKMITFTAQFSEGSLSSDEESVPLSQGAIEFNLDDDGSDLRYIIPVACRLRHIGGQVWVDFIEEGLHSLLFDIYKNGVSFHQLTITTDPPAGTLHRIYESDISGKNFAAGDNMAIFISATGEDSWSVELMTTIATVLLEIT